MTIATTLAPNSLPMVVRADQIAGLPQGQWTYDDYAAIPDDGHRYEVISGVLYKLPTPNIAHQSSNGRFFFYLFMYIEVPGLGRVFHPPTDVELAPFVVVQPDLVVILKNHLNRITFQRIVGAPDLVVEVASPGTSGYDRNNKLNAYAAAGVPEYWIADPVGHTVEVLILEQGNYRTVGVFQGQVNLPSQVLPNLPVQVEQFFV